MPLLYPQFAGWILTCRTSCKCFPILTRTLIIKTKERSGNRVVLHVFNCSLWWRQAGSRETIEKMLMCFSNDCICRILHGRRRDSVPTMGMSYLYTDIACPKKTPLDWTRWFCELGSSGGLTKTWNPSLDRESSAATGGGRTGWKFSTTLHRMVESGVSPSETQFCRYVLHGPRPTM